MKFFIPLGFRYNKGRDGDYSLISSIYGPYGDDKAVREAIARLWPDDNNERFLVFDGQIVDGKPSAKEKPDSEKRAPGNMDNYVKDGEAYKCKGCGGAILGRLVGHPVHLREMPDARLGECRYETALYCPNCEKEPDFHGAPVYA